jgi:hypothetical protein
MKTRRNPPATARAWEAHSACTASLGVPDRGRYRRTPHGEPIVADLVHPGMTVRTSYSTGGVVVRVEPWEFRSASGEVFPHHTIVYVPPGREQRYRDSDLHWINECVAIGGRILMLFEANTDEVFIDGPRPPSASSLPTILII